MTKKKNRRSTRYWRKREDKIIRESGGVPTPASGALTRKGDGEILGSRGVLWRQELKSTESGSFKLTKDILRKLWRECRSCGGEPMLIIDFVSHNRRVYVFPEYMIEKYTDTPLDGNVVDPWTAWRYVVVDDVRYCILPKHIAIPLLGLEK